MTIDVPEGAAHDGAGNGNLAAQQAVSMFERTSWVKRVQEAWLARFGGTVAGQVLMDVEERLAERTTEDRMTVAGRAVGGAEATATRSGTRGYAEEREAIDSVTERELLAGTAFHLSEETDGSGFVTLWGRGAFSSFRGDDGSLSLEGRVSTATLGVDYATGRWIAGLSLLHSRGEGAYRDDEDDEDGKIGGDVASWVTGLYPYVGYDLTERLSVWGVVSYGTGELTLTPRIGTAIETRLGLALAAVGARGELVSRGDGDGFELALKTDGVWVGTNSAGTTGLESVRGDATRWRLALEDSWKIGLANGGSLDPSIEFGLRHDGGDAETGTRLEVRGGLRYADLSAGLSIDLRAYGLIAYRESGHGDWGLSGAVRLVPDAARRGPSLSLSSGRGADGNTRFPSHLDAEIGYGLAAFDGRFTGTPYAGLDLSDAERSLRLGWRLTPADDPESFRFVLEGSRRDRPDKDPDHAIGVEVTARW